MPVRIDYLRNTAWYPEWHYLLILIERNRVLQSMHYTCNKLYHRFSVVNVQFLIILSLESIKFFVILSIEEETCNDRSIYIPIASFIVYNCLYANYFDASILKRPTAYYGI